jgi:uncharacterized phage protein (TIGR01671 family)
MREIKFRSWDKKYNYMIESEDIHPRVMNECITGDGRVLDVIENSSYMGTDVNYEDISNDRILMQFTGLKDKNGKEIYEGDIVDVNYFGRKEVVEFFVNAGFACFMPFLDDGHHWNSFNCEVVGNIYENPELIK